MRAVSQLEVEQILAAFSEIESEDEIELCYIVVNKKTNTELYAQGVYEDDSYKNPVPGTVIDCHSDLTRATEFFLISQSQKQGLAFPCKYTILHDTIGCPISDLELLSYKLCHLYFNIPGPIKIPAPILYAHKLANLVAERNELELENGPEREPIKIHESFQGRDSTLYFI
jgi:aubergine-like protein